MTNYSASDIAARRIREARTKRGWTVKALAARCADAGAIHLTAAVITNLETRRAGWPGDHRRGAARPRLGARGPAVQLMTPVGGDEALEVVPGEEMGPLQGARLARRRRDRPGPRPLGGKRLLRDTPNPPCGTRTTPDPRQAGRRGRRGHLSREQLTSRTPREHPDSECTVTRFATLGVRLLHFLEALDGLGYERPDVADALAILASHGVPATLAELEQRETEEDEPDGEDAWPVARQAVPKA